MADHDQALRNVEPIQASLATEVVCVGIAPAGCGGFQPIDFRVGVVDEFGDGVCGQNARARGESLLKLSPAASDKWNRGYRVRPWTRRQTAGKAAATELLYRRICAHIARITDRDAQFPATGWEPGSSGLPRPQQFSGQNLRRQLVEVLGMHGQMRALGSSIGHVHDAVPGELMLNVQVPLLHVWGRVVVSGAPTHSLAH